MTYQNSTFIFLFLNFICLFMNVAIKTGSSPKSPPKSKLTVFDSPITPTLNIVSNLILSLVWHFLWAIEKLHPTLHHQCLFISARGGHLHFFCTESSLCFVQEFMKLIESRAAHLQIKQDSVSINIALISKFHNFVKIITIWSKCCDHNHF